MSDSYVDKWNEVIERLKPYNPRYGDVGSTILISKKNTFRIEINVTRSTTGVSDAFGTLWGRTEFGGYEIIRRNIYSIERIIEVIEGELKQPEVEKTQNHFNPNEMFQNVLGRKLLDRFGKYSKITRLATQEFDCCSISTDTIQTCEVFSDRTDIKWRDPNGHCVVKSFHYNIMEPHFDPDKLVRLIIKIANEVGHLGVSMRRAWADIETEWKGFRYESK